MKQRVLYIEVLRILACLAVILIHVTAALIRNYDFNTFQWNCSLVIASVIRWCIPLFFMISGKTFLDREEMLSWSVIIKKYIKRILIVLVFWGIFYYLFDLWIYDQSFGLKNIVLLIIGLFSGNNGYHLWYLYELILIYLFIPALKILVNHITQRQLKHLLLIIFGLSGIILLLNNVIASSLSLNGIVYFDFSGTELLGYVGCVLLGYYLAHFSVRDSFVKKINVYVVVSMIIMVLGNYTLSQTNQDLTLVWADYYGIFSVNVAMFIFLYMKKKIENGQKLQNVLFIIADKTFGIYLVHVIWVSILFHKLPIDWSKVNPFASIGLTLCIFVVSFGTVWVLKRVKILRNVV